MPLSLPEQQLRQAAYIRGLQRSAPADPAAGYGHFLARLPVSLAIHHLTQVSLPAPVEVVYTALWTAAPTAWQAVRDCYNAGLRGPWLKGPDEWWPATLH